MQELERSVLGCDYGATSWTTRLEAERIASLLELRPMVRLLDIGAGSGWPALYLATISGCDVTLSDIPMSGLRAAVARASLDGLRARCQAVAADGAYLPFADASFDALSHSDVLCCMPDKLSMLRECRRVARSKARMAFSVIAIGRSIDGARRRAAIDSGPTFVVSEDYAILLDWSGWRVLERKEISNDFAVALKTRICGINARCDAITEVRGPEWVSESLERLQATLRAVEGGLLQREAFCAIAGE
ncbi:class I SAM-dependent methyltransferase [Paraburkholderia sp. BL10I2N1]|uniref:class I SAM-dependent methyltransferase n=1 Tax=Paraburkholderia sp. BL10I2N1 TaxID=1938796 RepID=UPI001414FBC3|nr:class I SAM-dependent methyltransferase [Paraburkholderia sp. BL10I2N1]